MSDLVEDLGLPAPRWASAVALALFLAGSAAPVARWVATGEHDTSVEKELRAAAEWPETPRTLEAWDRAPSQVGKWFDDRFPFRRELLRLHNLFVWFVLRGSPDPEIQRGKDGWLFLGGGAMDHYRGCNPFPPAELDTWIETYDGWRDWLAARDIEYILLICPDKQANVPEFLPDWVVPCSERTRTDAFFEALRERSEISVLDVREETLAAKAQGLTFFQHGTHWNSRGAWPAYVAIAEELEELFDSQRVLPRDAFEAVDFTLITDDWYGDSWFERLHVADVIRQEAIQFKYLKTPTWGFREEDTWMNAYGLLDGRSHNSMQFLPKAVLLRDSTAEWLWPFLVHHFRELLTEGALRFPAELIERELPDVVIQTRIERILSAPIEPLGLEPEEVDVARAWNAGGAPHELLSEPGSLASGAAVDVSLPAGLGTGSSFLRLRRAPAESAELLVRLADGEAIRVSFAPERAFALVELPVASRALSLEASSSPVELQAVTWRPAGG